MALQHPRTDRQLLTMLVDSLDDTGSDLACSVVHRVIYAMFEIPGVEAAVRAQALSMHEWGGADLSFLNNMGVDSLQDIPFMWTWNYLLNADTPGSRNTNEANGIFHFYWPSVALILRDEIVEVKGQVQDTLAADAIEPADLRWLADLTYVESHLDGRNPIHYSEVQHVLWILLTKYQSVLQMLDDTTPHDPEGGWTPSSQIYTQARARLLRLALSDPRIRRFAEL